MKNKCINCKYLKRPWEPDYDWSCACGLDYEKYIGEDDSGGCHYSEDMLGLLSEWQDLCETLSWYSLDFYSEFEKLKHLEERFENKKLNNEEITLQEEIEIENARKDYRKLCYMAEDPYISFERSLIIKGKLMSLRWILNRIDELMKEASDEIQTHTALRP